MSIHKPRTRVVFFRVSEEEFENMTRACDTVGARSISDFARTAAIRLINSADDGGGEALKAKMSQIDAFLERLQWRVQAMAEGNGVRQPLTGATALPSSSEDHL